MGELELEVGHSANSFFYFAGPGSKVGALNVELGIRIVAATNSTYE
jgi:hypothetical protein